MNPGIEAGKKVEMGRGDEQGHESQQRHQTRPEAFPGNAAHAKPILRPNPGAWISVVWLASIAFLSQTLCN